MKVLTLKLVVAALLLVSAFSPETGRRVDLRSPDDSAFIIIPSRSSSAGDFHQPSNPAINPEISTFANSSRPALDFHNQGSLNHENTLTASRPALPYAPRSIPGGACRVLADSRNIYPVSLILPPSHSSENEEPDPRTWQAHDENIGEHNSGPEISFDLLADMVSDDPWQDILSESEDNPFSHVIYEMSSSRGGNGGSSANESGDSSGNTADNSAGDNTGQAQDQGDSSSDNGGRLPTGGDDADQDDDDGVFPQVMVFWAESGVNQYACTAQLGNNRFRFGPGDIRKIDFTWLPYSRSLDEHYLLDDFNHDGLTDVLITPRSKLTCQLHLNAGEGWTALPAVSLPYVPTSASRISLPDSTMRNLVYYSNTLQIMEILEMRGNGAFNSVLRFQVPANFDSLSTADFNRDGLDDLVLINFEQNRAFYLLNVNNRAFRPMSGNLMNFSLSELIRFVPKPSGLEAKLWWCTYGTQNLLYLANYRSRPVPVATLNPLDAKSCLLLGDFNQDGIPDIGIGRLVN